MSVDLTPLMDHDLSDDCPVCRAQDIVMATLLPAASAWELHNELPRFSVALHGAAELLGAMLEEGVGRKEVDAALARLLDDIEARIGEERAMGGPTRGSA